MSGIYIPDMDIPKNCFLCFAQKWFDYGTENHGYLCRLMPFETTCISNCVGRKSRRDNCPLVPVPDGRLIDADALAYHAERIQDPTGRCEWTVQMKYIDNAPTIIPTKKGEEQ